MHLDCIDIEFRHEFRGRPCFHAAFNADCARAAVRGDMRCPTCRAAVAGSQRIFFA
jgi:hypothetical protein